MPNWKKVVVSGSDATLNSLYVAGGINATSLTGSLLGNAATATSASYATSASSAGTSVFVQSGDATFNYDGYVPFFASTQTAGQLLYKDTSGGLKYNPTQNKLTLTGSLEVTGGITGSVAGVGSNTQIIYNSGGNLTGDSNLTWDGSTLTIVGTLEATEKSFKIPHAEKPGHSLVYGVLEGPEHAVYARGKSTEKVINLPEEWTWLVDESTITVQLTSINSPCQHYVTEVKNNQVHIDCQCGEINTYYFIQATRKDIEPLEIVQKN